MFKQREIPPTTLAEVTSKIVITPEASNDVIADIDRYKEKMSATVLQSKRPFRIKIKDKTKRYGKAEVKYRGKRYSSAAAK